MPQPSFTIRARTADGWSVPVTVTRKRVRNLNLRVHADGSVTLSIPLRASADTAQEFLDRRADWIRERVERREARAAVPLVPPTGADAGTLPLWGELVDAAEVLGLKTGAGPSTFARFIEGTGDAAGDGNRRAATAAQALAELGPEELSARVGELYRREVARVLPDAVARIEAVMGVHTSRWSVRRMTSRWGSCTPKTGAIRISGALAAYPPACLDYVVAHELTHLLEPSHNARFHALLDRFYPRNREVAAILKHPAREACQAR